MMVDLLVIYQSQRERQVGLAPSLLQDWARDWMVVVGGGGGKGGRGTDAR